MATMTAFKVRSGFHNDGNATYRKGQIFKSEKPLHKMFPNKFDMVSEAEAKAAPVSTKKEKGKRSRIKVQSLPELGKDVTQKFPDAINKGLRVFQNDDGEYSVTDERDIYSPLNKSPMTRIKTKKFLVNR